MILIGDVRERLKELPDQSINCCVTSPPYWGLRDYGNDGQIGLEQTPDAFIAELVSVFSEVKRVLRDDGTLWLNIGDSYASFRDGKATPDTSRGQSTGTLVDKGKASNRKASTFANSPIKHKDLVGIPWMLAFALRADGWYLRQDIIWHKPNPMPESVMDRCTKAHEYIFLLTKSPKYYFDNEAIKEPSAQLGKTNIRFGGNKYGDSDDPKHATKSGNTYTDTGKRNKRSVWSIPVRPFKGAHFATFPTTLIEPCILAGTSDYGICNQCGTSYERIMVKGATPERKTRDKTLGVYPGRKSTTRLNSVDMAVVPKTHTGWKQMCKCESSEPVPSTVLDPFFGAGTTGLVAQRHNRKWIGCELNPEYAAIAQARIESESTLFTIGDTQ
jgi:DNA modification methylase